MIFYLAGGALFLFGALAMLMPESVGGALAELGLGDTLPALVLLGGGAALLIVGFLRGRASSEAAASEEASSSGLAGGGSLNLTGVNGVRAAILFGNLGLVMLIGYVCYGTFFTVDRDDYFVEPPKLERYVVPEAAVDESQQKKELYKAITRTLDRAPPPPPPPPVVSAPPPPAGPDPSQIKVLAIQYSADQGLSSALMSAPLASSPEPKFFQVGLDIGSPGLGYEQYKDCKVKAIGPNEVIVTDQKGKDVRLPGPGK